MAGFDRVGKSFMQRVESIANSLPNTMAMLEDS